MLSGRISSQWVTIQNLGKLYLRSTTLTLVQKGLPGARRKIQSHFAQDMLHKLPDLLTACQHKYPLIINQHAHSKFLVIKLALSTLFYFTRVI